MNETCLLVMYLSDKDDCEEECIGVDQTFALLPRPAAAHESHHEDNATNDHQEDRGVHIVVPQEVQVILGINLGPGSKANENTPSEDEEDIEEDHEVLHEAFATVLHDEAVRIESEKGIECKCLYTLVQGRRWVDVIGSLQLVLVVHAFCLTNLLRCLSHIRLLDTACTAISSLEIAQH